MTRPNEDRFLGLNRSSFLGNAPVNSNCALSPSPRATAGHLPTWAVPGVGLSLVFRDPGQLLANLEGTHWALDTHAVYISKTWRISVAKRSALWRIG